jgi:hypothetical protein
MKLLTFPFSPSTAVILHGLYEIWVIAKIKITKSKMIKEPVVIDPLLLNSQSPFSDA